jgi:hypothetical protein
LHASHVCSCGLDNCTCLLSLPLRHVRPCRCLAIHKIPEFPEISVEL